MKERLQKIIAHAGIASRRKAEQLILEGQVTVNGKIVVELGAKADPLEDHIKVSGKLIRAESFQYFAVYKPQGVLCAAADDKQRPLVTDLVRSGARLYPEGRLDFSSEGLVILTNDGALTKRMTTAGQLTKVYRVKVQGQPKLIDLERLRNGIRIADGTTYAPCRVIQLKTSNNSWYEVVLKQGKNRQIRRMFEHIGHRVMRLRRTAIGPVRLGELRPGMSRRLTAAEVASLMGERKQSSQKPRRVG